MPDSVEQPFVLYLILGALLLLVLELFNRSQPVHCPIGKFPGLRPTDVHVFSGDNNDYQFNTIKAYACTQAWTCSWGDTCFDSINSSLPQHQVSVVPFIGFPVTIRILFDGVKLGAYHLSEFFKLHGFRAQPRHVQGCGFIIVIRQSMGRIIKCPLQIQLLCCFVHFLEEVHDFDIVFKLGGSDHVGRPSYRWEFPAVLVVLVLVTFFVFAAQRSFLLMKN